MLQPGHTIPWHVQSRAHACRGPVSIAFAGLSA